VRKVNPVAFASRSFQTTFVGSEDIRASLEAEWCVGQFAERDSASELAAEGDVSESQRETS
jgi:hypothetical protein